MDLTVMLERAIKTNDLTELYRIKFEVNQFKNNTIVNYTKNGQNGNMEKADVNQAKCLLEIVDERIEDVKNETSKFNLSFRLFAKKEIDPTLYTELCHRAKNYHRFTTKVINHPVKKITDEYKLDMEGVV